MIALTLEEARQKLPALLATPNPTGQQVNELISCCGTVMAFALCHVTKLDEAKALRGLTALTKDMVGLTRLICQQK